MNTIEIIGTTLAGVGIAIWILCIVMENYLKKYEDDQYERE